MSLTVAQALLILAPDKLLWLFSCSDQGRCDVGGGLGAGGGASRGVDEGAQGGFSASCIRQSASLIALREV